MLRSFGRTFGQRHPKCRNTSPEQGDQTRATSRVLLAQVWNLSNFYGTFVNAAWCCTRFGHLYSWNTSSTCNIQHVATRRNWETKCAQKSCVMLRRSDRLATCFGVLGAEVLKRVDSRFFRTSLAPNCTSSLMKISGHLPPSNIKFLQQRATLG